MPIYEYDCKACGEVRERLQKSTDPAPLCPNGCGERMAKKVSASGFILKGSGWERDGYK